MLTEPHFMHSKIVLVWASNGERLSFKNDNLFVSDKDDVVKLQYSCYKIFLIFVVGGFSLTSGVIEKAKQFGFSIVFFSHSFKFVDAINFKTEGNTLLREKQYNTAHALLIAKEIVINKIENQIVLLKKLRSKECEGIDMLKNCIAQVANADNLQAIMGYEGIAAKAYFNRAFKGLEWIGRQPRVKRDLVNLLLDIGYTVLFNYLDALLNLYGFDTYKGNLHQIFYNRKSLTCDMVEPFRPIIDNATKKIITLNQITEKDYQKTHDGRISVSWKSSAKIVTIFINDISNHKQCLFRYIQSFYRWFMKNASSETIAAPMPKGEIKDNDFD